MTDTENQKTPVDPQVAEWEWRYAQGEGGGGYHENYDGTPNLQNNRWRSQEENQIVRELVDKGQNTNGLDINQIWLMRKYGRGGD
ncbi:MAG: hypothetical protein J6V11_03400 [Alphaproteobacteria bacterium]|nr:hypothetical protein [Alphaproteobacteria bacterium]